MLTTPVKRLVWYLRVFHIKPKHLPIHTCVECKKGFIRTRSEVQQYCVPCLNKALPDIRK